MEFNGYEKLKLIEEKLNNEEELTEAEIMTLSFILLMDSKFSKMDITIKSIELAKNIKNKIKELPIDTIDVLITDIFDLEK